MKSSTIMIILTAIIIAVASFGKYVDGKIHASATTILEDRLKPGPLLSHRFDYYGTYIDDAFSTNITNIDTLLTHKGEILKAREETGKDWKAYLATYLVPEEDSVAHLADKEMVEVDKKLDAVFDLAKTDKVAAQKLLDESKIKESLPSITDKVNWLTDLQTRVGQEETVKMLSLIATFDNFMIGSLALAVMLAGSILYAAIRDRKEKQPVKKVTKKVIKRPTTKKKPVKKPIKKK
jgi:hypothetical protein